MPSKPRRQPGFGRRYRDLQQQRGPKWEGAKRLQKVQVSLAVGAFAARWRWSRGAAGAGPPRVLVRLPTGLVVPGPGCGVRAASGGCQRDAINMRRKKQPACPAQSWEKGRQTSVAIIKNKKSQQSFAPSE